jgi:hypothetical protein
MTGQEGVARRAMGRRAVVPQGTRFEEVLRALPPFGSEEACGASDLAEKKDCPAPPEA